MPRNLDNRIEVVTPVYAPDIKEDLKKVVELGLNDTMQARIVDGTGTNDIQEITEEKTVLRSQEELYKHYLNKE
jgi:polyphosphate kinase